MDLAASEFYDDEKEEVRLKRSGQGEKTSEEMIDMIASFVEKYPLITVEDALSENDWAGWQKLTARDWQESSARRR
jgi:enolase